MSASRSGMSPDVTTTTPSNPAGSASRPQPVAWPVPSCCSCTATAMVRPSSPDSSATAGAIVSRSWPSTTTRCCGATLATECSACASMLRPASVCSTFGMSDRIRVPAPAASTITAVSVCELTGLPPSDSRQCGFVRDTPGRRSRTARSPQLRRQDSNLNSQNQNLMCCRLHHDGLVNWCQRSDCSQRITLVTWRHQRRTSALRGPG